MDKGLMDTDNSVVIAGVWEECKEDKWLIQFKKED